MKTHIMKDRKYTYCSQPGGGPHSTVYALPEDEVTEAVLVRPITCRRCVKGFRRDLIKSSIIRERFELRMQNSGQRKAAPARLIPEPSLSASEITSVLARLADIWRGSDEATALRSAAGHLSRALAAKSDAFDAESFWRDCRIDAETDA